jgi:hypothetical protein
MTGDGEGATTATALVVVTTDAATTIELSGWLGKQLGAETMTVRHGFYAAMTAIARGFRVVVANVGVPNERDVWRLAELRTQAREATVVVVADATVLPRLVGPLRPDLAVRAPADLPPLRELLVTGTTGVDDQTMRRRSRR